MRLEGFSLYLCSYVAGVMTLAAVAVFVDDPGFLSFPLGWLAWGGVATLAGFSYLALALVAFALVRVPSTPWRYAAHLAVALGTVLTCAAIQIFTPDRLLVALRQDTLYLSAIAILLLPTLRLAMPRDG